MVSIAPSPRIETYEPVNSSGPFPISFPVFDGTGADLLVMLDDDEVSGWTFSGTLESGFYGEPNTWINGSITFDAPISGDLLIKGLRAPRRQQQFEEGRGVPARDHNTSYNVLTAVDQEARRDIDRAVSVPDGELGFRLPRRSVRSGRYIAFDTSGDPILPLIETSGFTEILRDNIIDSTATGRDVMAIESPEALLDYIGAVSIISGVLPARAAALALAIPAVMMALQTSGYANPGDGGGALYKRVVSAPATHDGWFQSLDGAYWELAERERVTPEMFGAKRDNVTDDGPAWNKAIRYVNVKGGGEVVGLPGQYRIGTRIELKSSVRLRSLQRHKAVLAATASIAGGHIMFADQGQSQIAVQDFNIVGNYAGSGQSNHGILIFNCSYVTVTGNLLANIEGAAIILNGAVGLSTINAIVRDNYVSGCYWGVACFKNCIDVQITGNVIDGARNHGVLIDEATNADSPGNSDPMFQPAPNYRIKVDGNIIKNCATSNTGAGVAVSGSKMVSVSGNTIQVIGVSGSGGGVGIVVNSGQAFYNDSTDVTITGNQINTIYMGPAIQIAGVNRFAIGGNVMHSVGLGASAASTSVIQVLDDNAGSGKHTSCGQISGNSITGTIEAPTGIYLGPGAFSHRVGSNDFVNLTTDVRNDDTGGSNSIDFIGSGTLPAHIAGWRGRIWVDVAGKAWVSNNAAWVGIGTQT